MSQKSKKMLDHIPDIMTVSQLQDVLQIGRSTAYGLLNSGALGFIKIGRSIRIPKSALDQYLCQHTEKCYNGECSGQVIRAVERSA